MGQQRIILFFFFWFLGLVGRAEVGYAVLTERGDTLVSEGEGRFPMMSVFKLHQAMGLCHLFEETGQSIDSIVEIPRAELNPLTWSPMLSENPDSILRMSIRQLLTYSLTLSDNNASNYLFNHVQSVSDADAYIATLIPRESFRMEVTEDEMFANHSLARKNYTTPLGAALLINCLFTDSIFSAEHTDFLRNTLRSCQTGVDRITAAFSDVQGAQIAHKTGSGFRDENGVLAAHNDLAVIEMPDGDMVTVAVFVKDFPGDEAEASRLIESTVRGLRLRMGI